MDRNKFENGVFASIIAFIFIVLVVLVMTGCAKTIYVPQESVEVQYIDKVRVDSVNVHDSIYIKEIQKGDTIWLTEYRYKTAYKYEYIHDTINVLKTDSIAVPYEVEVVKYKTRGICKFFAWVGFLLILAGAGWIGWKIYKKV